MLMHLPMSPLKLLEEGRDGAAAEAGDVVGAVPFAPGHVTLMFPLHAGRSSASLSSDDMEKWFTGYWSEGQTSELVPSEYLPRSAGIAGLLTAALIRGQDHFTKALRTG